VEEEQISARCAAALGAEAKVAGDAMKGNDDDDGHHVQRYLSGSRMLRVVFVH